MDSRSSIVSNSRSSSSGAPTPLVRKPIDAPDSSPLSDAVIREALERLVAQSNLGALQTDSALDVTREGDVASSYADSSSDADSDEGVAAQLKVPTPSAKSLGKRKADVLHDEQSDDPEESEEQQSERSSSDDVSVPEEVPVYDIDKRTISLLNNDKKSQQFSVAQIPTESNGLLRIRKGDCVELLSPGEDNWFAKVESIRTLNSELNGQESSHSTPELFFKMSWFYARKDFKGLGPDARWNKQLKNMGAMSELVLSDHQDWQCHTLIDTTHLPWFAAAELSSSKPTTDGPLHLHSILKFDDVYPAPSSPSTHLLSHASKSDRKADRPVPPYLFGDRSGADGDFDGVPYSRTEFSFKVEKPLPPAKQAKPANAQGKHKKARRSLEPKKADRPIVKELAFNKFSLSQQPYQSSHVQYYDRRTESWISYYDLDHKLSFLPASETASRPRNILPASPSSAIASGAHIPSPPSTSASSASLRGELQQQVKVEKSLGKLANSQIARGGAYGLTGNAYLVAQAARILQDLQDEEQEAEWDDLLEEARSLLQAAEKWKATVDQRGVEDGMELGRAPPSGKNGQENCWVSPGTNVRI